MIARALVALAAIAALTALLYGNLQALQRFPPELAALLLQQSFLPRLAVSLLCGGGLALAGLLFQQVLQNPLAEPATLGVAAGASLAISAALVCAPGLLIIGLPGLALLGASAAMLLLGSLAWRARFAPLTVILAGMVLSLYGNALNTLLVLFNHDYLSDLFSWQAGSLNQSGWRSAQILALFLLPLAAASALLSRPLTVLGLSEQHAGALGMNVAAVRALALAIAVALSAIIVSQAGIIGFIGLAAPALVRAAGVRHFARQLWVTPLAGALLLTLVDQLAQRYSPPAADIPTGAVTALFSAPLLLAMLLRQRGERHAPPISHPAVALCGPRRGLLPMLIILLGLCILGSLWLNRQPPDAISGDLLAFRWPRMLGALCAGAMLAVAGLLIQRQTGNVMASPELLGISSGAGLMMLLSVFSLPPGWLFPAALFGSLMAIGALFFFGLRRHFSSQKLVLTGLCLTSLANALTMILMLSGDPRALMLLNWSTGSTAGITAGMAQSAALALLVLLPLTLLLQRWLILAGLGTGVALSLGMGVRRSQMTILLFSAILTAVATLLVGPLSFVGLIAPQLARYLGARRLAEQWPTAALLGALLMVLADWLGRNIAWPWPVSAGLLTAFIGAPWFLWQLHRAGRR